MLIGPQDGVSRLTVDKRTLSGATRLLAEESDAAPGGFAPLEKSRLRRRPRCAKWHSNESGRHHWPKVVLGSCTWLVVIRPKCSFRDAPESKSCVSAHPEVIRTIPRQREPEVRPGKLRPIELKPLGRAREQACPGLGPRNARTQSEVPRLMSLGRSRKIRAGALSIGAFERGRRRLGQTPTVIGI
jgi:hypothetical protein